MCELLALSGSRPMHLTFSLATLAARGGATNSTHDGWGVAFYQGLDLALFREPAAAADSALVRFLESGGPATQLAISHIRHATRGAVTLANTQPLVRELGGRMHVFAHNGDLPSIFASRSLNPGRFRPIGETDSEHAFCALLTRLAPVWAGAQMPSLDTRRVVLTRFAAELREFGPANFLYSDGDVLFAHGDRRIQPSSGRVEAPGLWMRERHCASTDLVPDAQAGLSINGSGQQVVWFASVPLNGDADWRALAAGELVVVRAGATLESDSPSATGR